MRSHSCWVGLLKQLLTWTLCRHPKESAEVPTACLCLPRSSGSLAETLRRSLHLLFDKNFVKGLQIVDKGGVTCFVADLSRRQVFQVPLCSAAAAVYKCRRHL